jgi:hypothetical protein
LVLVPIFVSATQHQGEEILSFQVCHVCLGRRFVGSPLLSLFSFRATVGTSRPCHHCQGRGVTPLTEANATADWVNPAEPAGFEATTMPGVFNHEPIVRFPTRRKEEWAETIA